MVTYLESKELNINNLFHNKINNDEPELMIRDVIDEEIKEVMLDIGKNKALGPDGFTSTFFKSSWDIAGKDVCLAIHDFFNFGKLLGEVNATMVSLILKIPQPNKVSDFRPIACCNVLYKCISKILFNEIKCGFDKIVNLNQSAFIPGRIIQDNLMLSQELLKVYNFKNRPSIYALKIDIAKACDKVNWYFLEKILNNFRFHKKRSSRGLRQGDPTSLYLFTIVMCKDMKLNHLSFADDLLVICHKDENSIKVIIKNPYGNSVENLNEPKSKMNWSNIPNDWKDIIGKLADLSCNNNIRSALRRILLATAVYQIWKERNARIFTNKKANADNVLQKIIECIILQLQSLKVRKSTQICKVEKE
nr:hypothetical protein [Tanacetum cinerariifolium]